MHLLLLFALLSGQAFGKGDSPKSVYTPLSGAKCKFDVCPGVGGYQLKVLVEDSRSSITVVAPDKKEHDLDFWILVTGAFSHLGEQAEWLVSEGDVPVAMISRVVSKRQSTLVVTKIASSEICVVANVKPGKKQNEKARTIGAKAASMKCL